VEADSNMTAISKFSAYLSEITSVYDTLQILYSLVYRSREMLEHFGSSKVNLKQIPLISFFKEDNINAVDLEIYKKLLHENYRIIGVRVAADKALILRVKVPSHQLLDSDA